MPRRLRFAAAARATRLSIGAAGVAAALAACAAEQDTGPSPEAVATLRGDWISTGMPEFLPEGSSIRARFTAVGGFASEVLRPDGTRDAAFVGVWDEAEDGSIVAAFEFDDDPEPRAADVRVSGDGVMTVSYCGEIATLVRWDPEQGLGGVLDPFAGEWESAEPTPEGGEVEVELFASGEFVAEIEYPSGQALAIAGAWTRQSERRLAFDVLEGPEGLPTSGVATLDEDGDLVVVAGGLSVELERDDDDEEDDDEEDEGEGGPGD